jgi:hypothetical protein
LKKGQRKGQQDGNAFSMHQTESLKIIFRSKNAHAAPLSIKKVVESATVMPFNNSASLSWFVGKDWLNHETV